MQWFPDDSKIGFIPAFLSEFDPRSAAEQFDQHYAHGGGWNPWSKAWKLITNDDILKTKLKYPGDTPVKLIAYTCLHDETIMVFQYALVAIVQTDGTMEVSRMD